LRAWLAGGGFSRPFSKRVKKECYAETICARG
jgi:hypothetical protein